MTEKVFYQDSHKVSCEAEVLACEPKGTQYLIALDRTVFFPEGGGQYAGYRLDRRGESHGCP